MEQAHYLFEMPSVCGAHTLTKPLLLQGDAVEVVKTLDENSIQTVVTSPPYWALRDYGDENQFGAEPTVEDYAANLVRLFEEIKPK